MRIVHAFDFTTKTNDTPFINIDKWEFSKFPTNLKFRFSRKTTNIWQTLLVALTSVKETTKQLGDFSYVYVLCSLDCTLCMRTPLSTRPIVNPRSEINSWDATSILAVFLFNSFLILVPRQKICAFLTMCFGPVARCAGCDCLSFLEIPFSNFPCRFLNPNIFFQFEF